MAAFGSAVPSFQAFHMAVETSKRSRAWTGSLAAPDRRASVAALSQTVAIERRLVGGVHAVRRYEAGAASFAARRGGTLTSTIRSARTSCRTLSPPHG